MSDTWTSAFTWSAPHKGFIWTDLNPWPPCIFAEGSFQGQLLLVPLSVSNSWSLPTCRKSCDTEAVSVAELCSQCLPFSEIEISQVCPRTLWYTSPKHMVPVSSHRAGFQPQQLIPTAQIKLQMTACGWLLLLSFICLTFVSQWQIFPLLTLSQSTSLFRKCCLFSSALLLGIQLFIDRWFFYTVHKRWCRQRYICHCHRSSYWGLVIFLQI